MSTNLPMKVVSREFHFSHISMGLDMSCLWPCRHHISRTPPWVTEVDVQGRSPKPHTSLATQKICLFFVCVFFLEVCCNLEKDL